MGKYSFWRLYLGTILSGYKVFPEKYCYNNFDPNFWNWMIIINVEHPVHFGDVISSDKEIDKVHCGVFFALDIFALQSASEGLWKFF